MISRTYCYVKNTKLKKIHVVCYPAYKKEERNKKMHVYLICAKNKKCRKDKPETKEIGYLQGAGGKRIERRREWKYGSIDEEAVTLL